IMLLIQKMAYETSSDLEKVREKSDEGLLSLSRFKDHVKSSLDLQQRESQNKLGESLKQMREGLATEVDSMKKDLKVAMEASRQETAAALSQMKIDIEKQEKAMESSLDAMNVNLNNEITRLGNSTDNLGRELKKEISSLNEQNTRLAGKMRLTFGILLASNGITLLLLVMFLLGVFK
ncbi:MAG TPA: hypothetical protein VN549_05205, partial [Negativicutes bacterium]|nr:hypothetical protein [Negativicutes bacterium]